jgi:diguanylate cyclase (GGDEF)-like protein
MHDDRLVRQATRSARRVMLACLGATAMLLAALGGERVHFLGQQRASTERIRQASAVTGDLLLQDDILTMSANMAAATGETHWVEQYNAHLPMIDSAIAKALRLSTHEAGARYQLLVKDANDSLVALEGMAFDSVRTNNLRAASAILSGDAYAAQKHILADGNAQFLADLQRDMEQNATRLRRNSWMLVAALLVFACLGFVTLWRRLNIDLSRSENAFRETQQEITRMALHDTLTGLPNRRYLHEQLNRAMARRDRGDTSFATLVIDLDGFKPINDRYGHGVGDQVLTAISTRLATHVRGDEMAARVGGDEFVVVLNRGGEDDGLLRASNRLIRAISEPITIAEGVVVRVGASVGVSLYPDDATDAEELVRRADVAMYRAKEDGRGGVRFFQQSMDAELHERALLETDLRFAIGAGQIVPFFQPLIDLQTRTLTGFEALARWNHPEHGLLMPDTFIHIAEDTRQIGVMTVALLRTAMAQARAWDPALTLAVNIAPQMLEDDTLVAQFVEVAAECEFPCHRLEIEITESALIRDLDAARRMIAAFKSHGISVALDDFGTGYSSLSHLSELPFDKIKIDRSFVSTMRERPQSATIVTAIIGLGRSMQVRTTAEGIEDQADEELLRELGCLSGQGFLYSEPVPAADIPAFLRRFALTSREMPAIT